MKKKLPKKPELPQAAFLLPPPNDALFASCGRLGDLREGKPAGGEIIAGHPVSELKPPLQPLGTAHRWFEPWWLEQLCLADEALQKTVAAAQRAGYSPASLKRIRDAVRTVFEEQYLVALIRNFDDASALFGDYFAARAAHKLLYPEDFEEPPHAVPAANQRQRRPPKRVPAPDVVAG